MNDKILCYLTAPADSVVKVMVEVGFDQDLALAVLEQLWPEDAIFEIPGE